MDETAIDLDTLSFLQWSHTKRRFTPKDEFFSDGDFACDFIVKHTHLETPEETGIDSRISSFPCCISGCKEEFDSIVSYEHHYNSLHLHHCSVCSRSFPTNHLLSIHLLEWHDPMFEIQAEHTDMHQCLVESCSMKFKTPKHRRKHMIEVHKYPSNYRFDQAKKTRCIASQKSASGDQNSMEVDSQSHPTPAASGPGETTPKRVFSYKVPKSICFGKGTSKGFQHTGRKKKHWHQSDRMDAETTVNIEKVDMAELGEALVEST
ncbi:zinc finger protein 511-like [Gigantopelta aegis]|uniref:zinc finger protein 511-like n=1 Tax=Gigantopelta aegis TaxID=1735272 RepID=UPI001B8894B9|nr:zinc finger protein 511-like [Gigantopelta aegis]